MELFLIIAFIAAILSSITTIIDKHLVGRIPPRAFLLLIGVFGIVSIVLFPITGTAYPEPKYWAYGIGIGMLFGLLIFCWFRAYRIGEVGRIAPLSIFSTILITIGGFVFFHEAISQREWIALGLFLIGGALLSLRLERQLIFLDPKNIFKVVVTVSDETAKLFKHPVSQSIKVTKQFLHSVEHTTGDITENLVSVLSGKIFRVRARTKIRLIKGFWWATLGILLAVPYTLLAKELNNNIGVISGFVTIRIGILFFALIMLVDHVKDVRDAFKDSRAILYAVLKEPFGMVLTFLVLYASLIGPLGLVRSVLSFDSAFILIGSVVLARFGFIEESLRRREIVQKTLGVLFLISGSLVLFL